MPCVRVSRRGRGCLEDEARRRAVDGVDEPVFQQGKQVGTIRKHSDTLLIFLLKGIRPQEVSRVSGFEHPPPAELDKLIQAELEARGQAIKLRLQQEKEKAAFCGRASEMRLTPVNKGPAP